MITLIAAHDRNRAIGKDGDIPWHIPEDLAMFKRETLGGAIVMGRKTWESLPFKPLKDRLNIVVSRDTSLHEHVVGSVEDAIALAQSQGYFRIYGIGGQRIYEAMLPLAHRLLITEVDTVVEEADAFFPDVGEGWREVSTCVVSEMALTNERLK
ncbi:dihydrofolate reductase [Sagittula stellata]|uniref:Dihydrofolate reductase n=1 Tax=Sagittula stellata (strain ATCC 700073 / DSM 11524 / E-37) TaxID=388399 RepID=A3K5B9_SAGS3|nr:dihydrofolate reductase [Sagittula stellata]EBA07720.1 Dihydrofolate reductase [Sagittula stellata E-37]